jgi:hypothetical protein
MRSVIPLSVVLFLLLPSPIRAQEESVGEVAGDQVRLRAGPSTRHAILTEVDRGGLLVILGREGRWFRVRVPGGFPCFVHRSLLRLDPDGTAVVSASRVLMRVTAGKEVLPLESVLERGDVLAVLGESGEWVRVVAPDRAHLYVFEELLTELGPAVEYRRKLAEQAAARLKALGALREAAAEKPRDEEKQKKLREAVLTAGRSVLAGEGDTEELLSVLRGVVLESDDDLTRGYANALLALLGLRAEAEDLREEVGRADAERADEVETLRSRLADAEGRYAEALQKARVLQALRESPYRGVGTIEVRDGHFVLVDAGRRIFRLESKRFRLADYVGRRVGVNGRMVISDTETGERHLMVEKLEILEAKSTGR